jgi:cytochrome b involved in lipid metabolism
MGNPESKSTKIQSLEKQQQALMRDHAEMAKRLAQAEEDSKKQQEASIEQMAKLMILLIAAKSTEKKPRAEKQVLEIEGVNYVVTEFINRGGFGEIYK